MVFVQSLINLSFISVSFEIRVALGKLSKVLWLFNIVDLVEHAPDPNIREGGKHSVTQQN